MRSLDCPVCRRHLRPFSPRAAAASVELAATPLPALDATAGLSLAIEAGNPGLALTFVEGGARVSGVPPRLARSLTPLMYACEAGSLELCAALLDRGANPNERATPDSRFPLLIAAVGGRREVLQLLLARGADVDATMSDYQCQRRTALVAAAAAGQVEIVALLAAAGANLNAYRLRDGSSALAMAAARGALPTVRCLLAAGAHVNLASMDGTTPLHMAAAEGWVETCRVLLASGAETGARRLPYGWTPLHEAAARLDCDIAPLLLASNAAVNALDSLGRSPLAVACEKRWASMAFARLLRRAGGRNIAPRSQTVGFRSLFQTH